MNASHLLISLTNISKGAALALVDLDTFEIEPFTPRLPANLFGSSGLISTEEGVFVALQLPEARAAIATLDPLTFAVTDIYFSPRIQDPHSLAVYEGDLLVVSTGTDEVVRLSREQGRVVSEEVVWRAGAEAADNHHLNGILIEGDRVLLSLFGRRPSEEAPWSEASQGRIIDLENGDPVIPLINQPHSIMRADNGDLAWCASADRVVCLGREKRSAELPGYVRGLCSVRGHFYAGTSIRRRREFGGSCTVIELDSDLAVQRTLSADHLGGEIYDILPIRMEMEQLKLEDGRGLTYTVGVDPSARLSEEAITSAFQPEDAVEFALYGADGTFSCADERVRRYRAGEVLSAIISEQPATPEFRALPHFSIAQLPALRLYLRARFLGNG